METQTNQWGSGSNPEKKQMKKSKSADILSVLFLAFLIIAFASGCSGNAFTNVKDAFSSSNDAIEDGIDDGTDAIEDGIDDGEDAIDDAIDDVEDEFQTEENLVSVAVTPTTSSIKIGAKKGFVAKATYLNGSTRTVTSSSTWSSGTSMVATTSGTSTITGVGVGTSVITANYLGKTGSATLTVTSN